MGARVKAMSTPFERDNTPADWSLITQRLAAYLNALGVTNATEIAQLSEQVQRRVTARAAVTMLEDAIEAAIEETLVLLDDWLLAELGSDSDANTLAAARAAVLGGEVPGWTARWVSTTAAERADPGFAAVLRGCHLVAVPPLAPLAMHTSTIDLCCQRSRRRISGAICRFFCQPETRKTQ